MSSGSLGRRAALVLAVPVFWAAIGPAGVARAAWGYPFAPAPVVENSADAILRPTAEETPPPAGQSDTGTAGASAAASAALPAPPDDRMAAGAPSAAGASVAAGAVVAADGAVETIPSPPVRPRFLAAVAMGASVDSSWSASTKTFVVPAFAATIGFGDGPLGFEVRLLSSQAAGRGAEAGPDRLALDLMLALRPWAPRIAADAHWGRRVLRATTLELGLAAERISAGAASDLRAGLVVGGHVDLPVTAAGGDGELRLRVAVRRMVAGDGAVGTAKAGDSTEALAGLVIVF